MRLADFGSCQKLGANGMVLQRAASGSPNYAAPESMRGHEWGPKYDMWSLGCVFYEAVVRQIFAKFPPNDALPVEDQLEKVTQNQASAKIEDGFVARAEYAKIKEILKRLLVVDEQLRPSATEVCGKYRLLHNLTIPFEKNEPPKISAHQTTDADIAKRSAKKLELAEYQMNICYKTAKRSENDLKKVMTERDALKAEVEQLKRHASQQIAAPAEKRTRGEDATATKQSCSSQQSQPPATVAPAVPASPVSNAAIDIDESEEEGEVARAVKTIVPASELAKDLLLSDEELEVSDTESGASQYAKLVNHKKYLYHNSKEKKQKTIKDLDMSEEQQKYVELSKYRVAIGSSNEAARKQALQTLVDEKAEDAWHLIFCLMGSITKSKAVKDFQEELVASTKGLMQPAEDHFFFAAFVIGETRDNVRILYKATGGKRQRNVVDSAFLSILSELESSRKTLGFASLASASTSIIAAQASHLARALDTRVQPAARACLMNAPGTPRNAIAVQLARNGSESNAGPK